MKLLLVGHGKMGQLVETLAGQYGCEVAGVIDPASPRHGGGPGADAWAGVDVAIDFSTPDAVAMPRNSGIATRRTTVPANRSRGKVENVSRRLMGFSSVS